MSFTHALIGAGLVLATAACTPSSRVEFDQVAGGDLDTGTFGNATMSNHQAMTGNQDGVLLNLARKFAGEAPTTITFGFNSDALDAAARATLDQQARWISQYPSIRFRVYGHTDKVGSDSYNKELGLRRAYAAVNYLTARGISRDRLEAVVSFGETQPLIVTQGRERRNRRTVTEVSGHYRAGGPPRVQDGKYALVSYRESVQSATEAHAAGAGE
ncbi:MAG: OmpA family protein [Celeribacter sp.]|jgi:outer membrane protein OmpA-like peptidoglycan-associated protein